MVEVLFMRQKDLHRHFHVSEHVRNMIQKLPWCISSIQMVWTFIEHGIMYYITFPSSRLGFFANMYIPENKI